MDQDEKIYDKALKFLERRPHSCFELKRKLALRRYGPKAIAAVISRLVAEDYLNDERFGEQFLDSLRKYKTFGFYGIKAKLLSRGLDRDLADRLLAGLTLEEEKKIAKKLLEKKASGDWDKKVRSLSAKGFRTEVIRQTLAESE